MPNPNGLALTRCLMASKCSIPFKKYVCQDFFNTIIRRYWDVNMTRVRFLSQPYLSSVCVCEVRALPRHLIRYITKPTPNGKRNVGPSGKSQKITTTTIWKAQWPTYNSSRPSVFTYSMKITQPVHLNRESRKKTVNRIRNLLNVIRVHV